MVGSVESAVVRDAGANGDEKREISCDAAAARKATDAIADLLNRVEDCQACLAFAVKLVQARRELIGDITPLIAHRLLDAHARLGEAHQLLGFPREESQP